MKKKNTVSKNTEPAKIIDGKVIANHITDEIKRLLKINNTIKPGLALILVGSNPASEIYVRMKEKKCAELGFYSVINKISEKVSEMELLAHIRAYNNSSKIHGILIQLPLPKHINERKVLEAVDFRKDVDGFHPMNAGRLLIGEKCFIPCTPAGIFELIKRYNVETSGKYAVVIGRSNIVGKPIANLLLQKTKGANCTVSITHSGTANITEFTKNADIIVAALGKPEFLKANMIKEGVVIIDVGINRIEDSNSPKGYKVVGDVDFKSCSKKASMITPVPGGVGPMTIAMLMKNTLDSALKKIYN
ncbi:MAG: bifunctional 5,10-methylenetetrahydrofolate dehydrogenase/5,10-methenyltetrahydrofolate cyclohydrolase [Ignavibacteria bacterium]|nr:bifunctional 5,10-methylenetetrahydrofolate dehydrogenase/5,10-methenyltetrahydrofolate cyclohydrolase [Ignavibacteria bacterium]